MNRQLGPVGDVPAVDEHADQFPDGTEVRYTIRTTDPAAYHLFTRDLRRRLRSAQLHMPPSESAGTLTRYRRFTADSAPAKTSTTYDLPSGRVDVAIDAARPGSHGYIRYHIESAVAYSCALDVHVRRASLLAVGSLAVAMGLIVVGHPFMATPMLGVAIAFGAPVGVNRLAASGHPISLSRWDVPTGP